MNRIYLIWLAIFFLNCHTKKDKLPPDTEVIIVTELKVGNERWSFFYDDNDLLNRIERYTTFSQGDFHGSTTLFKYENNRVSGYNTEYYAPGIDGNYVKVNAVFSYDQMGNIIEMNYSQTNGYSRTSKYAYNKEGKVNRCERDGAGRLDWTYDANGNIHYTNSSSQNFESTTNSTYNIEYDNGPSPFRTKGLGLLLFVSDMFVGNIGTETLLSRNNCTVSNFDHESILRNNEPNYRSAGYRKYQNTYGADNMLTSRTEISFGKTWYKGDLIEEYTGPTYFAQFKCTRKSN